MSSSTSYLKLIAIFGLIILFSMSLGTTHSGRENPSPNNYTVNDSHELSASYDDVNITNAKLWDYDVQLDRGVSVQAGGILIIRDANILLNLDNYSSCSIEVQNGGTLIIEEGSTLNTFTDTTNMYTIEYLNGAKGNITDSSITRCHSIEISSCQSTPFSHEMLIYNNTFYDWGSLYNGIIYGHYADKINITDNDFCNPDHDTLRTIRLYEAQNATIVGNTFHDYSIENTTTWGFNLRNIISLYQSATVGPIYSNISGNTFENLGIPSHVGLHCIFVGPPNVTISDNSFNNIHGFGIKGQVADATIERNKFSYLYGSSNIFSSESYIPSSAILLTSGSQRNDIRRNFIEDCVSAGIWDRSAYNSTIVDNLIIACNNGILLGSATTTSYNITINGNLMVSNSYGLQIEDAANATIYENGFLLNVQSAQSDAVDDIHWNKSSIGNLWYGDFSGVDSDHDWIADAGDRPFIYDANITDHSPVFKIGDLPPGSGDWYIDTPVVFQWNSISVVGDIDVVCPSGALILLNTSVTQTGEVIITTEVNAISGFINATFTDDISFYADHTPVFYNCTFHGYLYADINDNGFEMVDTMVDVSLMLVNAPDAYITGSTFYEIKLDHSTNVLMTDCTVTNQFYPYYAETVEVHDCVFDIEDSTTSYPFYIVYSSDVMINSSEIICGGKDISLERSSYVSLIENDIYRPDWSSYLLSFVNVSYNRFYYGGFTMGDSSTDVHNITFSHNTVDGYGGNGIYIDGENATIISNTIYNCSIGINMPDTADSVISHNTIFNCSGRGLYLYGPNCQIEWNTIYNVDNDGIRIEASPNTRLMYNNVTLTGQDGLYVVGSDNVDVMHNLFANCDRYGLSLDNADNADVYNNTMIQNDVAGIYLNWAEGSIFWLNILYENGDVNLEINAGGSLTFDNGTYGNFWGPSGPNGNDYCTSYDTGGNPWIGDVPFDVDSGSSVFYDNHPLLMNNPYYLNAPRTLEYFLAYEKLYVLNTTVYCLHGIYVDTLGNLTFVGTTIEFQSDGSYTQFVNVSTGGSLTLRGGAVFTANQTISTYGFLFRPDSYFIMDDATIDRCGYGPGNVGFRVNITTISIQNITVSNADYLGGFGIRLTTTDNVVLSEIVAINCNTGIWMEASNFVTLNNTYCKDCHYGIDLWNSISAHVLNADFDNCDYGIHMSGSIATNTEYCDFTGCIDYGIYATGTPTIYFNKFASITTGISLQSTTNALVYFNFFDDCDTPIHDSGTNTALDNGTHGNFYLDYIGSDPDGDLIGNTAHNFNGGTDIYPIMIWGSLPSPTQWDITVDTYCLSTKYTMSGNIEVYDGVKFYLYGTQLWFDCSVDQEYGIIVYTGGSINYDDGFMKAVDSSYRFTFVVQKASTISLEHVVIDGVYEIQIHTNSTVLYDLEISNTYHAIHFDEQYLYGLMLNGIQISGCEFYGIYLEYTNEIDIQNCSISDAMYGICLEHVSEIDIVDIELHDISTRGIYMVDATNIAISECYFDNMSDSGILASNHIYGQLLIEDSTFIHVSKGIELTAWTQNGLTLIIRNVTMEYVSGTGIIVSYVGLADISNCTFSLHGGRAIEISQQTNNFTIHDASAFNGSYFLRMAFDSHGTLFDCDILNFTEGVHQAGYFGTSGIVNITSNYFYGCKTGVQTCGMLMYIVGNTFEHGTDAIQTYHTHELYVLNNTIWDFNNGIFGGSGPVNITLSGNVYTDLNNEGIALAADVDIVWIYNETITNCRYGLLLQETTNVTADLVSITNAETGLNVHDAANATLSNFIITQCDLGIYFFRAEDITLRDFSITNCEDGIEYYISSLEQADLDIDTSNTYDGLPIYYFYNLDTHDYSTIDTHHLMLVYCSHVRIIDSVIGGDDLNIYYSDNCTLVNSTINTSLYLHNCEDLMITGNRFSDTDTVVIDRVAGSNLTLTTNSFFTQYSFQETGWNLNASLYGNYWYNYDGVDDDHNGIGDTPFNVAGMMDYHPLIANPWSYEVFLSFESISDDDTISDTTPIVVDVILVTGLYYSGTPSIDTEMLLNTTSVKTGTTGLIEYSIESSFSDGWYNVSVTSSDGSRTWTLSIGITLDTTAPSLSIIPDDMEATLSSSIQIIAIAVDDFSNLGWIAIYINGTVVANETSLWSSDDVQYSLSYVADGSHNVTVVAVDELGNSVTETITVYFDRTDPSISTPEDVVLERGTSDTLVWTVDDLTPSYYNITIGGISYENGTIENGEISYDIPYLDVGYYTLSIKVTDRADNYAYDYVQIQITEASTTSTTTTATTTDTTTDTSTTDTSTPPSDGDPMIIILVVAIGGVVVVIVVIVLVKKGIIKR